MKTIILLLLLFSSNAFAEDQFKWELCFLDTKDGTTYLNAVFADQSRCNQVVLTLNNAPLYEGWVFYCREKKK